MSPTDWQSLYDSVNYIYGEEPNQGDGFERVQVFIPTQVPTLSSMFLYLYSYIVEETGHESPANIKVENNGAAVYVGSSP